MYGLSRLQFSYFKRRKVVHASMEVELASMEVELSP